MLVVFVGVLFFLTKSNAQMQWNTWQSVPSTECDGWCTLPGSPNCTAVWGAVLNGVLVDCERFDSVPLGFPAAGVVTPVFGPSISCPYCPGCCDPPPPGVPCECWEPPYTVCGLSTVTVSETIIPSTNTRLSSNHAANVGIALADQVGYTGVTCTRSCPAQSPLCADLTTTALLSKEVGRTGRIDHKWRRWYTASCPPKPAFTASISCGSGSSTANATIVSCPLAASCIVTGSWCGPVCP